MTGEAEKYFQKAEHALEVARDLLEHGHAPDAASKIYYAMFYAAQALLKNAGIEVIKHSAVESAFGYYFVKPGKIDPAYHKMLISARKVREIADYDIQTEVIEPTASLKVEDGKAFIAAIKSAIDAHDKTGDDDAPQKD
jgi:uncharacterized protein (UPF0332 family)